MAKETRRKSRSRRPARRAPAKAYTPLFLAFLAVSLDGYIADKDGGVAWLDDFMSPELDFREFERTIGATVFGRTTFDWALNQGHLGSDRVIVLTHRPLEKAPRAVEAFSGDVRDLAMRLRAELAPTGKHIWLMGGGVSIAAFHAAGLVDRWELGIIPVVLGDGIPLFPRHSRGEEPLRLTHSRALKNGIIEAWCEPIRSARKP
jgi:dihydrofolate reductase